MEENNEEKIIIKPMNVRYMVNSRAPLYLPPINCHTCGHLIGNLWYIYTKKLRDLTDGDFSNVPQRAVDVKILKKNKTKEGEIMDELGLIKYCCRRTILTVPQNKTAVKYD